MKGLFIHESTQPLHLYIPKHLVNRTQATSAEQPQKAHAEQCRW
jgi:hypothetical protein